MKRYVSLSLIVLFTALTLAACSDDGEGAVETDTIDEDGGVVESPDGMVRLHFPAGAVSEEIDISIEQEADPGRDDLATGLYRFGPDDISFDMPVRVEFDLEEDAVSTGVYVGRLEDGGEPEVVAGPGGIEQNAMAIGMVDSFSMYGAFFSPVDPDDFEFELVKDINPDGNSRPRELTAAGDLLFFSAEGTDDLEGRRLWVTDGTEGGTEDVMDFASEFGTDGGSDPDTLTAFGGEVYFRLGLNSTFWASDGTEAGTRQMEHSFPQSLYEIEMQPVGDKLYFTRDELWVTDGTDSGTEMVREINPDDDSNVRDLLAAGDELFFLADDGRDNDTFSGRGLWRTDGTEAGTETIDDIVPMRIRTAYDGEVYGTGHLQSADSDFTAFWVTDGTDAGTRTLDIEPDGWDRFMPGAFVVEHDGKLFFQGGSSNDDDLGLWVSDGTADGTEFLAEVDIFTDAAISTGPSLRGNYAIYDGKLYFQGRSEDNIYGSEVWVTDGTADGTHQLTHLNTDIPDGQSTYDGLRPRDFTVIGDYMFFTGAIERGDGQFSGQYGQLWVSDGTEAGTVMLTPEDTTEDQPLPSAPDREVAEYQGDLYLKAGYTEAGTELWRVSVP